MDWAAPPLLREEVAGDGSVVATEVPPDEYTQIRWRVAGALRPDDNVSFIYRVRVDQ